jgi:phosphatidylglycerophosphatase A
MHLRIARWFVTGFGIGYFPWAPGTAGTLLGLFIFLLIQPIGPSVALLLVLLFLGVSVYAIHQALPSFPGGKDPSEIVIDEIVAILLILFLLPQSIFWWGGGFLLFRFFDITKPFPIRLLERLPGGWGIMADDLMAALYALGALKAIQMGLASRFFI